MAKLGKREMTILLQEPMAAIPSALGEWDLTLDDDGKRLVYVFDAKAEHTGIPSLPRKLGDLGIGFNDLETSKSQLEDLFVDPVPDRPEQAHCTTPPPYNGTCALPPVVKATDSTSS